MTKKKIERISVIHREKILWLKWYFMRDKEQPKYSVLERKMFDAAKNQDMLAYQKYATIKQITDIRVQTSPEDMLETIKEVYVYNHINIIGQHSGFYTYHRALLTPSSINGLKLILICILVLYRFLIWGYIIIN